MKGRRISILFASDAHVAAILRRGPSRIYHVIKWNTDKDTFEHGAWVKARIYEDVCDVSSDGEYLLYSMFQGKNLYADYKSFTGLSRLPWLKVLVSWNQVGTWDGGGRFTEDGRLALNLIMPSIIDTDLKTLQEFEVVYLDKSIRKHYSAYFKKHKDHGLIPKADWSQKDQNGRIIWTKGYQIFSHENGLDSLIADFSDLTPDFQPAPY